MDDLSKKYLLTITNFIIVPPREQRDKGVLGFVETRGLSNNNYMGAIFLSYLVYSEIAVCASHYIRNANQINCYKQVSRTTAFL